MDDNSCTEENDRINSPREIEIEPDVLAAMGIDDISKYAITIEKTTKEEMQSLFN